MLILPTLTLATYFFFLLISKKMISINLEYTSLQKIKLQQSQSIQREKKFWATLFAEEESCVFIDHSFWLSRRRCTEKIFAQHLSFERFLNLLHSFALRCMSFAYICFGIMCNYGIS